MKLGMVFEGGANRTVFSCGVMDKFLEENIMPDYYIGVSAGMAYGLSYLSGQKGRNLELMEKYMADKRYMGMRHLLNRKEHAYYNTKFVFEEVPNELLQNNNQFFTAHFHSMFIRNRICKSAVQIIMSADLYRLKKNRQ